MGVAETCFVPRGTRIDSWIVFGNFQGYHFLGAKKMCLLSKSTVGHLAILSNRSFLPGEMPPPGSVPFGIQKEWLWTNYKCGLVSRHISKVVLSCASQSALVHQPYLLISSFIGSLPEFNEGKIFKKFHMKPPWIQNPHENGPWS